MRTKPKQKAIDKYKKKVEVSDVEQLLKKANLPQEVIKDPRKIAFFNFYFDRESPTWGNMKQSAIAAGFTEDYGHNITSLKPKWLYDFIGRMDAVGMAEAHLKEVLTFPNVSQAMGAFGPLFKTETIKVEKKYKNGKTRMVNQKVKTPIMVANVGIIKEKTAVAKIILPAYSPELYGRKQQNNTFVFNVKNARAKYNGSKDAQIS